MKYVFKINNNLRIYTVEETYIAINNLGEEPKYYTLQSIEKKLSKLKDDDYLYGIKAKNLKKMLSNGV